MKAISLWQPWASLVAIGVKPDETRSWPAPASLIGQDLVICSAQRCKPLEEDVPDPDVRSHIERALAEAPEPRDMKYGRALCIVTVTECMPTERRSWQLTTSQFAFGDYTPGRFAWVLTNVRRFKFPPHVCGRQGLFDFQPPEGMMGGFE